MSKDVRKWNVGTSVVVPGMYWLSPVVIGKLSPMPEGSPFLAPKAPVGVFQVGSSNPAWVRTRRSDAPAAGSVLSSEYDQVVVAVLRNVSGRSAAPAADAPSVTAVPATMHVAIAPAPNRRRLWVRVFI